MSRTPLTPAEHEAIDRLSRLVREGSLYTLLGLDQRATRDDVETAYRTAVREWHPDRFFSRDAADRMEAIEDNFVEITRAYKTLRDNTKRGVHDAELCSRGVSVPESGVAREERVGFEVQIERRPTAAGAARPTISMAQPLGAAAPRAAEPQPAPPAPAQSLAAAAAARRRGQLSEQLARAADYYKAGLEDFNAGRFSKAESSLYLAMRYDSRNATYSDLFKQTQIKAKQARAGTFVNLGIQAEQFGSAKDALTNYRKAVECEPEEGVAYFRLAKLVRSQEEDTREALNLLRKAAMKEPKNAEFRLALAELYVELKMEQNALREAQAAAEADPKNDRARALAKQLRASAR